MTAVLLDSRYEIREQLGRGGMAEVFRAWDRRLARDVAIKLLNKDCSQDPGLIVRFRQESRALAQLNHPGIVTLFDSGETEDGRFYLVMERLQGQPFDALLRGLRANDEVMPWRRLAGIVRQLCGALQAAHAQQIVHRDIKPSNLFLNSAGAGDGPQDHVKILDFGIAKMLAGVERKPGVDWNTLTASGLFIGTPHYAAPEAIEPQIFGTVGVRADVYAIGVLMYQCVTGMLPFEGEPKAGVIYKTAFSDPPTPRERAPAREIAAEVEEVVMRAIARQQEERFASVRALAEAIAAIPEAPGGSRAKAPAKVVTGQIDATTQVRPARAEAPEPGSRVMPVGVTRGARRAPVEFRPVALMPTSVSPAPGLRGPGAAGPARTGAIGSSPPRGASPGPGATGPAQTGEVGSSPQSASPEAVGVSQGALAVKPAQAAARPSPGAVGLAQAGSESESASPQRPAPGVGSAPGASLPVAVGPSQRGVGGSAAPRVAPPGAGEAGPSSRAAPLASLLEDRRSVSGVIESSPGPGVWSVPRARRTVEPGPPGGHGPATHPEVIPLRPINPITRPPVIVGSGDSVETPVPAFMVAEPAGGSHSSNLGLWVTVLVLLGVIAAAWAVMPEPPTTEWIPKDLEVQQDVVNTVTGPGDIVDGTTGVGPTDTTRETGTGSTDADGSGAPEPDPDEIRRADRELERLIRGFDKKLDACAISGGLLQGLESVEIGVTLAVVPPRRALQVQEDTRTRRLKDRPARVRDCVLKELRALRMGFSPVVPTTQTRTLTVK